MSHTYKSDVVVGEHYRDNQTGIEGIAVTIAFHQHGCERVILEWVKDGEPKWMDVDAPRLSAVATGRTAKARGTGAAPTTGSGLTTNPRSSRGRD